MGEFTKQDLQRYERAKERAETLGFLLYIPHLEAIVKALKEIIALDDMFVLKK